MGNRATEFSRFRKAHGLVFWKRRGSGGIGRRAGLRIQWSNPWGFESPLSHVDITVGRTATITVKLTQQQAEL